MHPKVYADRETGSRNSYSHTCGFDDRVIHENCKINITIDIPDTGVFNLQLHIMDSDQRYHVLAENSSPNLTVSMDYKLISGSFVWEGTNFIDQMAPTKRESRSDDEDMPTAKRPTIGGPNHRKLNSSSIQMSNNLKEQFSSRARELVVIDLSMNDKQIPTDSPQNPTAVMKRLPPISALNKFPIFKNGSVHIILDPRITKYQYVLHGDVLSRISPTIEKLLDKNVEEAGESLKVSVTAAESRLELEFSGKAGGWILTKAPFTLFRRIRRLSKHQVAIKKSGTSSVLNEKLVSPMDIVSHMDSHASAKEETHKEEKGRAVSISSMGKSVECVEQTPAENQDYQAEKIDQPLEKHSADIDEDTNGSSAINHSSAQSTDQLAEQVEHATINQGNELIDISPPVNKEGDQPSVILGEKESPKDQDNAPSLVSISSSLRDPAVLAEDSTDISAPEQSCGITSSVDISNAPDDANASLKIVAQHVHPERKFSSSRGPIYPPLEVCEAYNNLFLIFYNKSPEISTDHIFTALRQCENMISIAKQTETAAVVRPHLGDAVGRFGQQLYQSIAAEPFRWLEVAMFLESAFIFKEAIIHIVGSYVPGQDYANALPASIPLAVQDFIISKIRVLDQKRTDANERLFASTITIGGEAATYLNDNPAVINTWFVVQIWRDWFAQQLFNHHLNPYKTGAIYRTLNDSGNAYLSAGSVKDIIERIRFPETVEIKHLEEDLDLLKTFAQGVVQELCENRSLLDIEEACVFHLTCTTVTDKDLPWYGSSLI